MIRAPYNFVPLNDKVYFPDWADKISQDIPFSDGVSGTIELTIEAKTPIFVRNGHEIGLNDAKGEKSDDYKSFSKTDDNKYFIPGTSIKGAIRNILEIMSCGKIRLDKRRKFAQREWGDETLYNIKRKQSKFNCGWLKWEPREGYYIVDCGKPYRIGHDKLDEYFKSVGRRANLFEFHFRNLRARNCNLALNERERLAEIAREREEKGYELTKEFILNNDDKYDPKTAIFKYALVSNVKLDDLSFAIDKRQQTNNDHRVEVCIEGQGDFKGTIVFTGQPNLWSFPRPKEIDPDAGKFYDFVFKKPQMRLDKEKNREVPVPIIKMTDEEFDNYRSIYENSPDWRYWMDKVSTTGIPVFFWNDNGKMKWGLALLFKLPYDKTPFGAIPELHRSEKFDLADCVFGSSEGDRSLKGRVSFGHALCTEKKLGSVDPINLLLSSPKASYYPIYVAQSGNNGKVSSYQTYNNGCISGWKRYLIRDKVSPLPTDQSIVAGKVYTTLYPLVEGTKFVSVVRFHNLRPVELGALLSALTFHNHPECFHQLGQGKPFGYGKVKITSVLNLRDSRYKGFVKEVFMAKFESALLPNYQVRSDGLIAMSSVPVSGDSCGYMRLSVTPAINEFQEAKNAREYLLPFDVNGKGIGSLSALAEMRKKMSELDDIAKSAKNTYQKKLEERKEKERIRLENEEYEIEKLRLNAEQKKIKRQYTLNLRIEAKNLFCQNRFEESLRKYQEVYDITHDDSIWVDIENCNARMKMLVSSLSDYLVSQSVSSIPAFATGLKKWMEQNGRAMLDDGEIAQVAELLKTVCEGLSNKERKNWNAKRNWINLNELLNQDLYSVIIAEN